MPLLVGAPELRDGLVMYLLDGFIDVFQQLAGNIASRFNLCHRLKRAYPLWRWRRNLSTFTVVLFDTCRFFHHSSLQGRKLLHILANHIPHSLEFSLDHGHLIFLPMRQQHRLIAQLQIVCTEKQPAGNESRGLGQQCTYRMDDPVHGLARCIQKQHGQYGQRQNG